MPACRTSCHAGSPSFWSAARGFISILSIAGRQFAPLPQTGRREALERRAAEEGAQPLLDELRAVDPERAARLSVSDVKRIVRALEIWQETGRTMTDFDRESRAIPPRYRPLWLGLHFPERAQLYARIDLRVELMYAQGLAQEVRALLDSGVPDRATSLQAIGYKQVVQALEEGLPPEAALGTIQQATRRYAKRQMTWFRAESRRAVARRLCGRRRDFPRGPAKSGRFRQRNRYNRGIPTPAEPENKEKEYHIWQTRKICRI